MSNVTCIITTLGISALGFELHTHGIGSKLLHHMSYNVGVLGKFGNGISHPIQPVKVRLDFVGTTSTLERCLNPSTIDTQFAPALDIITSYDSSIDEVNEPPSTFLIDSTLELTLLDSIPLVELSNIREIFR